MIWLKRTPIKFWMLLSLLHVLAVPAFSQALYFSEIVIRTDTSEYSWSKNRVVYKGESYLFFEADARKTEIDLYLYPLEYHGNDRIRLMPSAFFEEPDSLVWVGKCYRTHLSINDLWKTNFISLIFEVTAADKTPYFQELKLFPNVRPTLSFRPADEDLYIGEMKSFALATSSMDLIKLAYDWVNTSKLEWRIIPVNGELILQLIPKETGRLDLNIIATANRLFINEEGELTDKLKPITGHFFAKRTRLQFISFERKDITLELENKKGTEVIIENNRNLLIGKTYRIEDQIEPGGAFVGELFTRSLLGNDKVLCWIRPFALHKVSDGYLYFKDGDEAKFTSNFTISPKLTVSKVTLLREGSDWSNNLTLNPGENAEIKIEGSGLHKAQFALEEAVDFRKDSSRSSENVLVYRFKIPLNVSRKKLPLLSDRAASGYEILVKEYSKPKSLDFVSINYGSGYHPVTSFLQPTLYDHTIRDLTLKFNADLIDNGNRLFGKQQLTVQVNLYNNKREILESRTIDNIVVCPSEGSLRYLYYDQKDCNKNDIRINDYISRKSYDLPDWSRIEILVKHKDGIYVEPGFSHRMEIILQKHSSFDIEVSFPGGLLIQKVGDQRLGNFGGVSLAILGNFSFYHPEKVERLRPYKVGAGILAFNTFNFSNASNRDLGIVTIGSVYPINSNRKLRFPLHAGFGYFLQAKRWFYLLGPGIQISI